MPFSLATLFSLIKRENKQDEQVKQSPEDIIPFILLSGRKIRIISKVVATLLRCWLSLLILKNKKGTGYRI